MPVKRSVSRSLTDIHRRRVLRRRPVVGWLDRHLFRGADLAGMQRAGRVRFPRWLRELWLRAESRRPCGVRAGADVQAFALRSEQDQEFDRVLVGAAEPVWGVGIELGDFAGAHDDVQLAEEQA